MTFSDIDMSASGTARKFINIPFRYLLLIVLKVFIFINQLVIWTHNEYAVPYCLS